MSGSLHVKKCIRCGNTRSIEEFYAQPSAKDDRAGACIECVKADVKKNYRRNRDHYVKYDQEREQDPDRKAFKADAQRRYRANNPTKYRARTILSNAVRSGLVIKQPCMNCGATDNIHAHHHDYSKPLDVEWLCKDCHWDRHGGVRKIA